MPETVINRNLLKNPYEHFLHRPIETPRPPTPIVTLPPPRIVPAPKKRGPKPKKTSTDYIDVKAVRISDILSMVAAKSDFTLEDILGRSRRGHLVETRHVAIWLCRRFAKRSTTLIGKQCGGRDHTTVIHALRRVNRTIRVTKLSPMKDTLSGWIDPLLKAHGARVPKKEKPVADSTPIPAVGEQAEAASKRRGRPPKNRQKPSLQELVKRGILARRDGGKERRPPDWGLQTPGPRMSSNTEATA